MTEWMADVFIELVNRSIAASWLVLALSLIHIWPRFVNRGLLFSSFSLRQTAQQIGAAFLHIPPGALEITGVPGVGHLAGAGGVVQQLSLIHIYRTGWPAARMPRRTGESAGCAPLSPRPRSLAPHSQTRQKTAAYQIWSAV